MIVDEVEHPVLKGVLLFLVDSSIFLTKVAGTFWLAKMFGIIEAVSR